MNVKFRTTQLEHAYRKHAQGRRLWGRKVAQLFVRRIDFLRDATSPKDLYNNPVLKLHKLQGAMDGLYAVWIDATWRIILRLEDGTPVKATIEEVTKHYG